MQYECPNLVSWISSFVRIQILEHESGSWSPTSENLMESQYPLHRACRDGDLEALSLLLSVGTDFYQEDGFYGWTPIHWENETTFYCYFFLDIVYNFQRKNINSEESLTVER
jgi:hypothetical protein